MDLLTCFYANDAVEGVQVDVGEDGRAREDPHGRHMHKQRGGVTRDGREPGSARKLRAEPS